MKYVLTLFHMYSTPLPPPHKKSENKYFASSNPHPPHSRAYDRYNKFIRIPKTSTPNSHRPLPNDILPRKHGKALLQAHFKLIGKHGRSADGPLQLPITHAAGRATAERTKHAKRYKILMPQHGCVPSSMVFEWLGVYDCSTSFALTAVSTCLCVKLHLSASRSRELKHRFR